MKLSVFLELVEFKAKTASVLPFLIGLLYSWYNYGTLHLGYVLIYFVAMFIFNMAVDILDNYNDYKHATSLHDYKEKTNIIGRENLSLPLILTMIISFITISALMGIALSFKVGWPLLWMGMFCYFVGIFYSSGPKPLSSMPVGEFFSGFTMGFMISLICVYLNSYETFTFDFLSVAKVFLISLPNTLWISNLMLANNTCDLEEDEKNNRFTIVYYIGKKNAVRWFVLNNYLAFIAIILAIVTKLAPWTMLGTFVLFPAVMKQVKMFKEKQIKSETFICAVRILAWGSIGQVLSFALGFLFMKK